MGHGIQKNKKDPPKDEEEVQPCRQLAGTNEKSLALIASERKRISRKLFQRTTKFCHRMEYFSNSVARGIARSRVCDLTTGDFGYLHYVPGILSAFLRHFENVLSEEAAMEDDGTSVAQVMAMYRHYLHYFTLLGRDFSDAICRVKDLLETSCWPLQEKLEEIYRDAPEDCVNYHILDLFTLPFEELRMYEVFAKRFLAIEYDEKVRGRYESVAEEIEYSLKSINRLWDWDLAAELKEERRRRKYGFASEDELERLEFLWTWGCEHYEHLGKDVVLVVGRLNGEEDEGLVKLFLPRFLLVL